MMNPMAQVYKPIIFSKQDWHSDYSRLRSPVVQKKNSAETCYLYRRTSLKSKPNHLHAATNAAFRYIFFKRRAKNGYSSKNVCRSFDKLAEPEMESEWSHFSEVEQKHWLVRLSLLISKALHHNRLFFD